jgi:hypothetical protein
MPEVFSSDFDRRRAKRIQPGPLPVSMYGQDGVLIDVSETGALFRTGLARPRTESLAFTLTWGDESIPLHGRVVRAALQSRPPAGAALSDMQHHVAVEFQQVAPQSVAQLRRLLQTAH